MSLGQDRKLGSARVRNPNISQPRVWLNKRNCHPESYKKKVEAVAEEQILSAETRSISVVTRLRILKLVTRLWLFALALTAAQSQFDLCFRLLEGVSCGQSDRLNCTRLGAMLRQ